MTEQPDRVLEVRRADNDLAGFTERIVELLLAEPANLVDLSRPEAHATRIPLYVMPQGNKDEA